jgi:hypothetical protein
MVKDLSSIVTAPYAVLLEESPAGSGLKNVGKTVQKLDIGDNSAKLTLKYR